MKKASLIFMVFIILFAISCDKDDDPINDENFDGTATINLQATATGFNFKDLTPFVYELALVNMWLTDTIGNEVNIVNTNPSSPVYTPLNPLIVNFSGNDIQNLITNATIPAGIYSGYKMQFLYMEMRMPTSLHTPYDYTYETDYTTDIFDTIINRDFRLYFDAIDNYCKRDFVIELDSASNEWYWLRREVDASVPNYFIFNDTLVNNHPPGGSGPESIVDLFDDPLFWGPNSDLCLTGNPIIVGTHTTAGGVDCIMEGDIIVSTGATITLSMTVDVTTTMKYFEDPLFATGILDLGPSFMIGGVSTPFGDYGLHPTLPKFTIH